MHICNSRMNVLAVVIFAACIFVCANASFAQSPSEPHTQASLVSEVRAIYPGQKFQVALHLKLSPGWHTYWKNPGDSGMAPEFNWQVPKRFAVSNIKFLPPSVLPFSDMVDYGYENEAWLFASVTAPSILPTNALSILTLKARWLTCKDVCIPESGEFALTLPIASTTAIASNEARAIATALENMPVAVTPKLNFYVAGGKIHFDLPLSDIASENIENVQFFPDSEGFIVNSASQKIEIHPDRISLILEPEEGQLPRKAEGLVSLFFKNGERRNFEVKLQESAASSQLIKDILNAVLFAIAGGFILNLMPCVFPVLSLKALAIVKKSQKNPARVKVHGLVYTLGVILSFLALAGVLIAIQLSGKSIGWGYQMQSPFFVLALMAIFFLVGLSLAGVFEMPSL